MSERQVSIFKNKNINLFFEVQKRYTLPISTHIFIQTTTKLTPIYFNQHPKFRLVHNLLHLLPF